AHVGRGRQGDRFRHRTRAQRHSRIHAHVGRHGLGTVHYFAPEQAQGRPAVPQSDVYAVGIVLYEMLTGTLPFDAENPLAVAMQQINQAPTRPTRLNPAIPRSVEAIVLRALAENPADRFAGAAGMKASVAAARPGR